MSAGPSNNTPAESPFDGPNAPAFFGDPLHSEVQQMFQEMLATAQQLFPCPLWPTLAIVNGRIAGFENNQEGHWVQFRTGTKKTVDTIVVDATILRQWNRDLPIPEGALERLPYDALINAESVLRHQIAVAIGQYVDACILHPAGLSRRFETSLVRASGKAREGAINRIGLLFSRGLDTKQLPESKFAKMTDEQRANYDIAVGISPLAATLSKPADRGQALRADALAHLIANPDAIGIVANICGSQSMNLADPRTQRIVNRSWDETINRSQKTAIAPIRFYYQARLLESGRGKTSKVFDAVSLANFKESSNAPPVLAWTSAEPISIADIRTTEISTTGERSNTSVERQIVRPLQRRRGHRPRRLDLDYVPWKKRLFPGRGIGPVVAEEHLSALDPKIVEVVKRAIDAAVELCQQRGVYYQSPNSNVPIQSLAILGVSTDYTGSKPGSFAGVSYDFPCNGSGPWLDFSYDIFSQESNWATRNPASLPNALDISPFPLVRKGDPLSKEQRAENARIKHATAAITNALGHLIAAEVVAPSGIRVSIDDLVATLQIGVDRVRLFDSDIESKITWHATGENPEILNLRLIRGITLSRSISPWAATNDSNTTEGIENLVAEAIALAIREVMGDASVARWGVGHGATEWTKKLLTTISGDPQAIEHVKQQFAVELGTIKNSGRYAVWDYTAKRVGSVAEDVAAQGTQILTRRKHEQQKAVAALQHQLENLPGGPDSEQQRLLLRAKLQTLREADVTRPSSPIRVAENYITAVRLYDEQHQPPIPGGKSIVSSDKNRPDDPPLAADPPRPTGPPTPPALLGKDPQREIAGPTPAVDKESKGDPLKQQKGNGDQEPKEIEGPPKDKATASTTSPTTIPTPVMLDKSLAGIPSQTPISPQQTPVLPANADGRPKEAADIAAQPLPSLALPTTPQSPPTTPPPAPEPISLHEISPPPVIQQPVIVTPGEFKPPTVVAPPMSATTASATPLPPSPQLPMSAITSVNVPQPLATPDDVIKDWHTPLPAVLPPAAPDPTTGPGLPDAARDSQKELPPGNRQTGKDAGGLVF